MPIPQRVLDMERQIDSLKAERDRLVLAHQAACRHPIEQVREVYNRPRAPWRVCLDCGYAEEGWHCGYWKLHPGASHGDVAEVTDAVARSHVRTWKTQEQLSKERFGK